MPSSPRTPQSGQRSSGFDFSFTPMSLHSNDYSPANNSWSRTSSLHSVPSPATPRPVSSHSRTGEFSYSTEFGGAGGSGNGLGSLADELAEVWDEDGEVDEGTSGLQLDHEEEEMRNGHEKSRPRSSPESRHDRSIGLAISPGLEHKARALQSPTRQTSKPKHRRKATDYNWSDSGDILNHDDSSGIPSSLEAHLDDMERLAQQGTDLEADEGCKTLSESLRDLSSQANVENGVARYTLPLSSSARNRARSSNKPSDPPNPSPPNPHLPLPIPSQPTAGTFDGIHPPSPANLTSPRSSPTISLSARHPVRFPQQYDGHPFYTLLSIRFATHDPADDYGGGKAAKDCEGGGREYEDGDAGCGGRDEMGGKGRMGREVSEEGGGKILRGGGARVRGGVSRVAGEADGAG
ncbi:MAG: hypothetical protein Q9187_000215 [Circinaria calcarea]